jgi:hypothetical protein
MTQLLIGGVKRSECREQRVNEINESFDRDMRMLSN